MLGTTHYLNTESITDNLNHKQSSQSENRNDTEWESHRVSVVSRHLRFYYEPMIIY